jgi:urease accessory protein
MAQGDSRGATKMATYVLNQAAQDTASVVGPPDQVTGSLDLAFERNALSSGTFLASIVQRPPLRIVRPFRLEDGSVLVHLHNVSGGLLGGDCLSLSVHVGAGACVQLTSTGATRVYRSRENKPATTQINRFQIAQNGLLEYVPDAIIPFAKARFCQQTSIELEPGAGLFWWEILSPGRTAHGESFEYECVELKTDLRAAGQRIALENVRLLPQRNDVSSVARLGPYRYWATFYIVCVGLDGSVWLAAEERLREVVRRFHRTGEELWGVSTLAAHGLVVRGLTRRGCNLLAELRTIWAEAKLLLYGRAAIPPRKVN